MNKVIFQIMGGLALLIAAGLFVGGFFMMSRYHPQSFWDIARFCAVETGLVASGVGLLYLRKWAAIILCAMALYVASWEIIGALHPIPGYANWLGFIFGTLLAIPSILTCIHWRALTWRRSHYPTAVNAKK